MSNRPNFRERVSLRTLCWIGLLTVSLNSWGVAAETPTGLEVLVNQVGYLPDCRKTVVVQSALNHGRKSGSLEVMRDGASVHSVRLEYAGTLWGRHCWVGDFTSLTATGTYRVKASIAGESSVSPPFAIDAQVYDRALHQACRFFFYQRCGCEVPGWHKACHLDDGFIEAENRHIDAVGGWHSAADHNKWGWDGFVTYALAVARERSDGLPAALRQEILDEALWGGRYLLKMESPDGGLYAMVRERDVHAGKHHVNPQSDGDNVVGTADDRFVLRDGVMGGVDRGPTITGLASAALAKLASVTASADKTQSARFQACAARLWEHRPSKTDVYAQAAWVLAGVELHKLTGQAKYQAGASPCAQSLLTILPQAREFTWFEITHAGLPHAALGKWLQAFAGQADPRTMIAVREALAEQRKLLAGLSQNPYGLAKFYVRQDGQMLTSWFMPGKTLTRYSPKGLPGFSGVQHVASVGLNSYYASLAWSMILETAAGGEATSRGLAQRWLDWILGQNPAGLCMIEGMGSRNPTQLVTGFIGTHDWVPLPGAVPNGFDRPLRPGQPLAPLDEDVPFFDLAGNSGMGQKPSYRSTEVWLPNNATFVLALAELLSSRDRP